MIKKAKHYLYTRFNIEEETAVRILELLKPMKVPRGQTIQKQGDLTTSVFFVVSGCLRSYITDKKGKTHTLSFASEEWWIGDQIGISRKEPSMISIDAVEDAEIFAADREFFEKMPEIYEPFHRKSIAHMLDHLRLMEKRILYLLGAYGDERYLDFVETYPDLAVRLPQYMIASYLGLSRQSLSRIRNKLAQQNLP